MCKWKKTKNLIIAKTVLQSRIPKYKPLQSIYNVMHRLGQVAKGVMQKQGKVNGSKCKNAY